MNEMQAIKVGKNRPPVTAKGADGSRNRSGRITRTKILDAAEQVFAEKGISPASLREIMFAADVNIAAVNYYFGSKTDLLREVVRRRSNEINGARESMLAEACARGGGIPTIDGWIDALVGPFVVAEGSSDSGWRNFMRVLNGVTTAQRTDPVCREIVHETYATTQKKFTVALAAALPSLTEEETEWRFQCVVAILRSCVATRQRMEPESIIDAEGLQRMMDTIMPFIRGGLNAPPQGRDPQIK